MTSLLVGDVGIVTDDRRRTFELEGRGGVVCNIGNEVGVSVEGRVTGIVKLSCVEGNVGVGVAGRECTCAS